MEEHVRAMLILGEAVSKPDCLKLGGATRKAKVGADWLGSPGPLMYINGSALVYIYIYIY